MKPVRVNLSDTLAARVEQQICSGISQPGDNLPSEREMAATHAVSRATVRDAMAKLEHRGLVLRKHGVGAVVLRPDPPVDWRARALAAEASVAEMRLIVIAAEALRDQDEGCASGARVEFDAAVDAYRERGAT